MFFQIPRFLKMYHRVFFLEKNLCIFGLSKDFVSNFSNLSHLSKTNNNKNPYILDTIFPRWNILFLRRANISCCVESCILWICLVLWMSHPRLIPFALHTGHSPFFFTRQEFLAVRNKALRHWTPVTKHSLKG